MKAGKIARIIGLIAVVFVFGFGIYAANKPKEVKRAIWDEQTTHGSLDAKNYFVVYTDIMCPYCIAFENAIIENEELFEKYLEENDVLFEVKLTDFLYEYGTSRPINSRYSAEAVYCAKKEDKFWDYYTTVIETLWNTFFKEYGKSALSQMGNIDKEYWIGLGEQVGLGESFRNCIMNDETLDEVKANTAKTVEEDVEGMPYIVLNKFIAPGFDLGWGWDYVEAFFDEGIKSLTE